MKTSKTLSRIVSLVLAFVMLVGIVPTGALAAAPNDVGLSEGSYLVPITTLKSEAPIPAVAKEFEHAFGSEFQVDVDAEGNMTATFIPEHMVCNVMNGSYHCNILKVQGAEYPEMKTEQVNPVMGEPENIQEISCPAKIVVPVPAVIQDNAGKDCYPFSLTVDFMNALNGSMDQDHFMDVKLYADFASAKPLTAEPELYDVSMKQDNKDKPSMCDIMFDATAEVTVQGDMAKVRLLVVNPVPGFPDQGADGTVKNVVVHFNGQQYPAESDITTKPMMTAKDTNGVFGLKKGEQYPAQVLTFTLPAEALQAEHLDVAAYVNVVMMTDVDFDMVLVKRPEAIPFGSAQTMLVPGVYGLPVVMANATNPVRPSTMNSLVAGFSLEVLADGTGKLIVDTQENPNGFGWGQNWNYYTETWEDSNEGYLGASFRQPFTVEASDAEGNPTKISCILPHPEQDKLYTNVNFFTSVDCVYTIDFTKAVKDGGPMAPQELLFAPGAVSISPTAMNFETSVEISMDTLSPSGEGIRYTLDGSDPVENGIEYTEPFTITETTEIRAVGYCRKDPSLISNTHIALYYRNSDMTEAQKVADMIGALPRNVEEITLADEAAIVAAREAYELLTPAQKMLCEDKCRFSILTDAEAKIEELRAEAALPQVYSVIMNQDGKTQPSMCNPLFSAIAEVQTKDGTTTIRAYVVNPVPGFPDQGADGTVKNVAITFDGQKYPAESDLTTKPLMQAKATMGLFGLVAGKEYPAQVLTFKVPEDAMLSDHLDVSAYVNVVMMTDVDFDMVLTKLTAEDKSAAKTVEDQIAALGEITLESESAILAARAAFDGLSDAQRALVPNVSVLFAAEEAYDTLSKTIRFYPYAPKNAHGGLFMGKSYIGAGSYIGWQTQMEGLVLKAQPDENYQFVRWIAADELDGQGTEISKEIELTLSRAHADKVLTPVFVLDPAVQETIDAIDAIGEVTLDDADAIIHAWELYRALNETQQKGVTNYADLEAADKLYRELKYTNDITPYIENEPTMIYAPKEITLLTRYLDVTIYYTLDGSEPTAETGILYEGPFTVEPLTTVKAISVDKQGVVSPVYEHFIDLDVNYGYVANSSTYFVESTDVVLACDQTKYGVEIYYKLDDATEYTLYTEPFPITESTKVTFYTTFDGRRTSDWSVYFTKRDSAPLTQGRYLVPITALTSGAPLPPVQEAFAKAFGDHILLDVWSDGTASATLVPQHMLVDLSGMGMGSYHCNVLTMQGAQFYGTHTEKVTPTFGVPDVVEEVEVPNYFLMREFPMPDLDGMSVLTVTVDFMNALLGNGEDYPTDVELTLDYANAIPFEAPSATEGTWFRGEKEITLTSELPGAVIYYTLDGSDVNPGMEGTLEYTGPFTVTENTCVRTLAMVGPYYKTFEGSAKYSVLPLANGVYYVPITALTSGAPLPPVQEAFAKAFGDQVVLEVTDNGMTATMIPQHMVIDFNSWGWGMFHANVLKVADATYPEMQMVESSMSLADNSTEMIEAPAIIVAPAPCIDADGSIPYSITVDFMNRLMNEDVNKDYFMEIHLTLDYENAQVKADVDAAAQVDALIEAIGEVTLDDAEAIAEARKAYDALTDAQKALVQNLEILTAAEDELHMQQALAAAEAAKKAAEEAQAAAEAAQQKAEAAQTAAEEAAASAAEDKTAAEAARAKAETAKAEAEAAKAAAEEAQKAAEAAAEAAEASNAAAAEEAKKAAASAAQAAKDAEAAAEAARKAAEAQNAAQAAQLAAEEAQKVAEAAKADAKKAKEAAEEAAKSTASDQEAAEKAAQEAAEAQKAAEDAQKAAEDAKSAAEKAKEAAEASNEAAAKSAEEAAKAAQEAAEYFRQISEMKAEMAQYLEDAQAAKEAAEEAQKAAEAAALACAKYHALFALTAYADEADYRAAQWALVETAMAEGTEAIQAADSIEAVEEALAQVQAVIDEIPTAKDMEMAFTDVESDDWFYDAVYFVTDRGLFNGIREDLFAPNMTMDRAMLITVLYRLAGSPEVEGTLNFTDVPAEDYYTDALLWGVQNNIIKGMTETTFAPKSPVVREQMVTMLYRFAGVMDQDLTAHGNLSQFKDADAVSDYAALPMTWAVEHGLVNGMGDNLLAPRTASTRAQVATVLMRFVEAF